MLNDNPLLNNSTELWSIISQPKCDNGAFPIFQVAQIHKYTNFEFIAQILNNFWICVSFSLRVIYRPSPKIHLTQVPPLSRIIVILAFLDPRTNSTWSSVEECYLFLTVEDHENFCDLCNLCIPKFAPRRFWMKPNLGFATWNLCICNLAVGVCNMAVVFFCVSAVLYLLMGFVSK